MLALARTRGVLKAGGRQRSDSTHVLGAMRAMARLEGVAETLRHALDELATLAPEWLLAHTTPAWVDRLRPASPGVLAAQEHSRPPGLGRPEQAPTG